MLRIFIALWFALTPAFAWAGSMTLMGAGKKPAAAGGGLTVNTTASVTGTGATSTATFTTTVPNTVLVAFIAANGTTTATAASSTLGSWTQRATCAGTCSGTLIEFYKVAAGAVTSEVLTVTWGASVSYAQGHVIAIAGANTVSPFDPNGSLPGICAGNCSKTTTNATTIGLAGERLNSATGTIDSGWTSVSNTNFYIGEYVNPTVGNSLSVLDTTAATGIIVDAVTQ